MRLKKMPKAEFEAVFERQWRPVILEGDAQPSFLRAIPEALRCGIIASGQYLNVRLGISTSIRKERAIAPPHKSDQYHSWRNAFLGRCAGSTEMR